MRAAPGTNAAWRVHAEYYGERASAGGLLVAEASQISQQGQGVAFEFEASDNNNSGCG
jgi:N-ethylmaleimide reductase